VAPLNLNQAAQRGIGERSASLVRKHLSQIEHLHKDIPSTCELHLISRRTHPDLGQNLKLLASWRLPEYLRATDAASVERDHPIDRHVRTNEASERGVGSCSPSPA
jgi:hypothetical protein